MSKSTVGWIQSRASRYSNLTFGVVSLTIDSLLKYLPGRRNSPGSTGSGARWGGTGGHGAAGHCRRGHAARWTMLERPFASCSEQRSWYSESPPSIVPTNVQSSRRQRYTSLKQSVRSFTQSSLPERWETGYGELVDTHQQHTSDLKHMAPKVQRNGP